MHGHDAWMPGYFGVVTQGFPQLVRVSPTSCGRTTRACSPSARPVICQVRMVNESPLVPDFERLEEMIADETRISRSSTAAARRSSLRGLRRPYTLAIPSGLLAVCGACGGAASAFEGCGLNAIGTVN